MKLRPYQQEAIEAVVGSYAKGYRRPAIVMATGGGKTPTFASVAQLAVQGDPAAGVLVLAHRTELIEQAADKLKMVAPQLRVGVLQGQRREYRAQIVVGSVQTASRPGALQLLKSRRWSLIIIDECHHAAADTYVRILRELGAYEPTGPLVLGVTATLDRADGVALGEVFDDVPFTLGLLDLVRLKFLVPPRGVRVRVDFDLDRVKRSGGDFQSADLSRAMHDALAPAAIARAYREHADGRPAIAFLPTVPLSIEQAEVFGEHGVRALHLDGTTPAEERRLALKRYREGEIDVLCNVGLFTEGTDLPSTSCVILGRPTSSSVLYTQMVGRGLRLHPGKRDCVVLDVVGVTSRHRLATLASLNGAARPEDIPDELLMYEDDQDPLLQVSAEEEPAQDRLLQVSADADPYGVDGPLAAELVDLFGSAHAAWLRTNGGRWFIAVPGGFVYLEPNDDGEGLVDLRWRVEGREGLVREDPLTLEYAMAAGEEYVDERPMWQLGRDAYWRAQRPTTALRRRAAGLGITAGDLTRGELHDLVAVAEASRVLDR